MSASDTTTLLTEEFDRPSRQEMRAMGKTEARALSDALFERLAGLERESAAYSYVRGTIIELNMPLVRFAAGGFRRGAAELDDILQVGTVGLIKAVDGYDHRRGVEFATYAIPTITGEIKRFFRDTSWPLRVPRSLQELYLRVARCSDRLEQGLGRLPTPEEIAEELDLDPAEVAAGLGVGRVYRVNSLDALRPDREDSYGSALFDRLGACDRELDLAEFREAVRPLLRALPTRERTVLALRFWGGCTQAEIAEEIGVSQMHVSRLLAGILNGLRERLTDEPAGDGCRGGS
ncbi:MULTISPECIES: SigB/SigF/SigG family RNA polymerase sigma factor [unclassified Kitasatospora]|uniref:SigB/SigF/SigG family RNA polymerase sigma factor n=1 Tax=unclassified Kitasatospora TaxID=2633591 RepID=UPI00070D4C96|nr:MULTISPECIES: SigB/SigF/SigG family RNA polymerase sigma factor [unclassified Kitasatospora]KQV13391.1 RNA polymerase subunit sigma [Kitasatospora sp. Root107]KRB75310.1 RNA polymerase subunit sigma [Kitasatospora sp. Root187]